MIYLDNNATTRPAAEVVAAMDEMLREVWGNPSSTHAPGRAARQRIEGAREEVAALIGARARDVVFTAGGTESIHLAIRGVASIAPADKRTIVVSAVEHEAVAELCEFLGTQRERAWEVRVVPVDRDGVVEPAALEELVDDSVAVVSVQWANHETGVVQPVERIGEVCRGRGAVFHCDGVQWIGKARADVSAVPIDLLSMSAHKFHGPKGVGALWVRRGVRLQPLVHGVQERETRGGTENAPGIVGMGVAARVAREWLEGDGGAHGRELRDRLERGIREVVADAVMNGAGVERMWNTASVSLPGSDGKKIVTALSDRGVMCSTGAACSSGSEEASRVLLAMGVDESRARGTVRLSLSRETMEDEIRESILPIREAVELRRRAAEDAE